MRLSGSRDSFAQIPVFLKVLLKGESVALLKTKEKRQKQHRLENISNFYLNQVIAIFMPNTF